MSSESPHLGEHASDVSQELERLKIECQKQMKENEVRIEALKLEQKRVEGDQRIRTIAEETKHHQYREQYHDQMARKRYEDKLAQKARMYEMFQKDAEKEHKSNVPKTAKESITQVLGPVLGTAVYSTFMLFLCVGSVSMIVSGVDKGLRNYALLFRLVEERFIKPTLVRETSRFTINSFVVDPIKTVAEVFKRRLADPMKGLILEPALEQRLRDFALSARRTRVTGGYFSNMLLHGPSGTGKLSFSKNLARHSGLDFALMFGDEVQPLERKALTEVLKVFSWARTSRKGVVLVLEHADAFLVNRDTEAVGEDMNYAMNAFLRSTRRQSNKLMLILSSCYPEQVDPTVLNRIHEKVKFELPNSEEREGLMRLYFKEIVLKPVVLGQFHVEDFNYAKKFAEIADQTEGFSGKDICMLCKVLQARGYVSGGVLTEQMINEEVKAVLKVKQQMATRAKSSREMPAITTAGQQGASNHDDSRA